MKNTEHIIALLIMYLKLEMNFLMAEAKIGGRAEHDSSQPHPSWTVF